tara:strand:+ start:223 stop:522 length:300 start_codon:yes stop_codon:yes gene_type:complete
MKNISKKEYIRNSHYHLSDSKRTYVNISKSDKIELLVDIIRTIEVKLLEELGNDKEMISLMILLDDKETIKSNGTEKVESYIYYLNQLTSLYDETLNEK